MKFENSILLFLAALVALAPGALPSDEKGDLWDSAHKVFERSCFPCHGAGQRAARDFFVLKAEELSGNLKAVEKRVLGASGESRMPPSSYRKSFEDKYGVSREAFDLLALKEGDTAAIRKWIEAGGPIEEAKAEAAEFIRDEEVLEAILADALTLPDADRKYARYLSLANLLRAGDSSGDMALYRNGIRKLLASLTWRSQAPEVKVVEKSKGTVLRFNLHHLEYSESRTQSRFAPWEPSLWEEIAKANPYELPLFGEKALRLQRELVTKHVFLRADWFAFQTTQPALYARILGLPDAGQEGAVERIESGLLGLSAGMDIRDGRAARAGTTSSGVSVNHRIIERHARPDGNYYWVSYDFRAPEGRGNILEFPLGPATPGLDPGPHDFQHAGGEFIFSLPDGLQGYFLANAAGKSLATAPTDIVQNPRSRDAVVQNGISCLECHAQGMRPTREDMDKFQDQLRPFIEATAEDAEVLETVQRLHPGTEAVRRLIEEDRKRFEAALGRLGFEEAVDPNGRKIDAEPIFHLVDRFQAKVESKNAAAELSMTPDELSQQFKSPFLRNNRTMRELAARLEFTRVSRDEFVSEFGKLRELMGGASSPEAKPVAPPTKRRLIPPPPKAPPAAPPAATGIISGKNFTLLIAGSEEKLEFIWTEPGEFQMGSPAGELGRNDDETQHPVRITKGFWLGKTEVTQMQYQAMAKNNPSGFKNSGPRAPVENVTWDQAMAYCEILNAQTQGIPAGYKFSLPTEAQWEYACRAGTTGPIYFPVIDRIGWFQQNSESRTHPVGEKMANPWGLQDMIGNVDEWCFDYFGAYPAGLAIDPEGPNVGVDRIDRGGSWGLLSQLSRAARRDHEVPITKSRGDGFRVALRVVKN